MAGASPVEKSVLISALVKRGHKCAFPNAQVAKYVSLSSIQPAGFRLETVQSFSEQEVMSLRDFVKLLIPTGYEPQDLRIRLDSVLALKHGLTSLAFHKQFAF